MRQFLYFETLFAPKWIVVFFWLQIVLYALLGITMLLTALFASPGLVQGLFGVVAAVVFTAVMLLMARISAEVLVVIFKINENLKIIADHQLEFRKTV